MTTAQQPTPPPPEPPREPRRLTRSRRRLIAGVGGGLGRYFDVDPVIFRIALVALVFFGGTGLCVYAAIWLFVPTEGSDKAPLGIRFFHGDRQVWKTVAAITAVVIGSSLAAAASFWATGTGSGEIVAVVVIVLGLALAAAAFRGGARWLILPALAVALPAGVVSAADVDLHGGVGERTHRQSSVETMRDGYRLGVGKLTVDLRDVRLPAGDRELDLKLGMGELRLVVPEDVCVVTRAHVGAGEVRALDRDAEGADVDFAEEPTAPPGTPRLIVDADLGFGALYVSHRDVGNDHDAATHGTNAACKEDPAR
jgi:phage shock protein PspC (stress-responsive transcriptional regulator)